MTREQIQKDLKEALKGGRAIQLSTLRMLLAAVATKETEKRTKLWKDNPDSSPESLERESRLTPEEIIQVVASEVKKRSEAALEFERGQRPDLAEKEKKEIEFLKVYLPQQLSEEEIKKLARELIKEIGASGPKDIGRVMGSIMSKVKGRADGNLVSKAVKELLGA